MPDGMTPENKVPIDPMVSFMKGLGKPQELPGAKGQMEAAKQYSEIGKPQEMPGAKGQLEAARDELNPLYENGFKPKMQLGAEEERDQNKERLDHERRAQEMFGGKDSYMPLFLRGVRTLGNITNDTSLYDQQIYKLRVYSKEIEKIDNEIEFNKSGSVLEAQNSLKTEIENLRGIITNNQNIGPRKLEMIERAIENASKVKNEDLVRVGREILKRPEALESQRETLASLYENILHTSISETASLNSYLERFRNPYPYDSRWNLQFFEQARENVTDMLRNTSETKNKEGFALLKLLKRDMLWADANIRKIEAMGPAFELYFDGELMLGWVRTPHTELLARDFVRADKDIFKGAELSEEQRDLVRKTLGKRESLIVKYTEGNEEKEKMGLRELAINYQDSYYDWLYKIAATGQKNIAILDSEKWEENDDLKEEGEHYAIVDRVEFSFISEVFSIASDDKGIPGEVVFKDAKGKEVKVKEKILNPFCMPRNDDTANIIFSTRVHELVFKNDYYQEQLEKIREKLSQSNGSFTEDMDKSIKKLAQTVIDEAGKRAEIWEALDQESAYSRLADEIVRGVTNIEKGLLSGGDLGWKWGYKDLGSAEDIKSKIHTDSNGEYFSLRTIYKKDINDHYWRMLSKNINFQVSSDPANGEYVEQKIYKKKVDENEWFDITQRTGVVRESETGSIYDNHDVTTVSDLARHIVEYDWLADSRGTGVLPFPSVGPYRERWKSETPYFRPKIEEFAPNDKDLLRRLGIDSETGKITEGGGILSENNPLENMVARKVYVKGVEGIQSQYYGKFDYRCRDFVYQNMWAFQTPFLDRPGKAGSEYLVMPMLIPTYLPLGFWHGVSLDSPSSKISDLQNESVMNARFRGVKNSKMKWENMDKYKYSWIRVTNDQFERLLGPIITPHEYNRSTAPEYEKHYEKPSGKGSKESGKRTRLGGRMFEYPDGVLRATSFTENKILSTVPLSSITGVGEGTQMDIDKEINKWKGTWAAEWQNIELDMPSKVRSIYNYPGTSAQVAAVSFLQAEKIVRSIIKHTQGQVADVVMSLNDLKSKF